MPTLSSLILQRQAASIRAVEEAIGRQVVHGGDLATNLLELASIEESTLIRLLAESFGMEPCTSGPLPLPQPEALRLVPGDLALRHLLFPLSLDTRTLVVAISEPLTPAVEEDLSFALDVNLKQMVCSAVRVREAIAAHYGIPLDRRFLRLVAQLDGHVDPSPSIAPPKVKAPASPATPPKPYSDPPSTFAAGPSTMDAELEGMTLDKRRRHTPPTGGLRNAHAADPAPGSEAVSTVEETDAPPPTYQDKRAMAGWLLRAAASDRKSRAAPLRKKGPFPGHEALLEIEQAESADAVLEIFFAFAAQFFEYSVLFVVASDLAEGRDAHGTGASREKVLGIGVPLEFDSLLSKARTSGLPLVQKPAHDGIDAELVRDLGVEVTTKGAVIVLPLLVRRRVVALLWGDDGRQDVRIQALGELISFAGQAGNAIERVLLERKLGKRIAPKSRTRTPRPAVAQDGAKVLAGALKLPVPGSDGPAAEAAGAAETNRPSEVSVSEAAASVSSAAAALHVSPQASSVIPVGGAQQLHERETESASDLEDFALPDQGEHAEGLAAEQWAAPLFADEDDAVAVSLPPVAVSDVPPDAELDELASEDELADIDDARYEFGKRDPVPKTPPPPQTARVRPIARSPIPREDAPDETPESRAILMAADITPTPSRVSPAITTEYVNRDSLSIEIRNLLSRALEETEVGEAAFRELMTIADNSINPLVTHFPGPLRVDRFRQRDHLPAASQCGPLLEILVQRGRASLAAMTVRCTSEDPDVRFWAVHVLGQLHYPESATAIMPRLFDDDVTVRRVARRSAGALVTAGAPGLPLVRGLEHLTKNRDEPIDRRVMAIETMGEVRVPAMVEPLLDSLEDPSNEVGEAARRALILITRQDFERDVSGWHTWWAARGDRHRVEWLIDSLMHRSPAIRRAAGDELKHLTKEYFGYYDDLPSRERERAQSRYRDWWEREGRNRFVATPRE